MLRSAAVGFSLLLFGQAVAADLPDDIRKAGVLHLTVNATYAPMEYHDPADNELKGLDVDLAKAIAAKLGVGIVWADVPFAELIPSLQTKRADFVISGISDRASRRDNADFIDYLTTGPQFFTLAGSPVKSPADLCGIKVGAVRSTSFPVEIVKWSAEHCEGAGKVQGSETLPYIIGQEPNSYVALGGAIAAQYTGIALGVKETELQQAVAGALDGLIADGTYRTLLDKWQLSSTAVDKATINVAQ